jgi:hypothetical protein
MQELDLEDNGVKLLLWGATQSLKRRLEDAALKTKEAWLNIALLAPSGTITSLCYKLVGHDSNGQAPIEKPPTTQMNIDANAAVLAQYLDMDGHFRLSVAGSNSDGTHCIPFGDAVLLVSCVGFACKDVDHWVTSLIACELRLALYKLAQK